MVANPEQDFVLKTVESRDVHFVRFWFTDVLGNMKSFAVVPGELESAFEEGMGFDASCIEGFSAAQESDMLAFPDPSTFEILPWRPQANAVARMICDIRTPEGEPYAGDSRHVLERVVRRAAEDGYSFIVGPELEYFYFKDAEGTDVLDHGSYFDLTSLDSASDLRRDTVLTLEKMGIPVEYSHHEKGPSQHEIDLRYADALSMADAVMTYKQVVKEIAMKHGVYASFMPKPMADAPGNGMHVHQSLMDRSGNNVFFDPDDPSGYNLSATAKSYIAGLLKYAPEYMLITNQYVNSYKRLVPGFDAPVLVSWGSRNRSAMVRVPRYKPSKPSSTRIAVRSVDSAANPYLAYAAMLGAGLKGIEEGLDLCAPVEENLFKLSQAEIAERGLKYLPRDLSQAIDEFEKSELMHEILGDVICENLISAKRAEWEEYRAHVSSWEIDRYLARL